MDPDELPPLDHLVDQLVHAGYYAESMFTTGKVAEVEGRAIDDEQARVVGWVEEVAPRLPESVPALPYRRTLSSEDGQHWRPEVESRWPIEHGGWWEPINSDARDEALALDSNASWAGDDDGPATTTAQRRSPFGEAFKSWAFGAPSKVWHLLYFSPGTSTLGGARQGAELQVSGARSSTVGK